MAKRTLIKSILIISYCVLLSVVASFAWMLAVKPNIVEHADINYDDRGKLVVAPTNIEGKVIVTNEEGVDVELDENFVIKPSEIVPNSIGPFRIRFRNNTETPTKIDLSIVGITVDKESLLEVMYLSAVPTRGWSTAPLAVYKQMTDAKIGATGKTFSMKVLESVQLRPTSKIDKTDYLELSCYFYFDGELMTNEHQNITLSLRTFRITQI